MIWRVYFNTEKECFFWISVCCNAFADVYLTQTFAHMKSSSLLIISNELRNLIMLPAFHKCGQYSVVVCWLFFFPSLKSLFFIKHWIKWSLVKVSKMKCWREMLSDEERRSDGTDMWSSNMSIGQVIQYPFTEVNYILAGIEVGKVWVWTGASS